MVCCRQALKSETEGVFSSKQSEILPTSRLDLHIRSPIVQDATSLYDLQYPATMQMLNVSVCMHVSA